MSASKSYTSQINDVFINAMNTLQYLIRVKGKKSEVNNQQCLQLPDDFQDNVDGTYIVEVNETHFITDDGQCYQYDCIAMDRFCEITDQLFENLNPSLVD